MSESKGLFLPNTVCVVLQGRHAGKKCVVISAESNKVMVVGISNLPKVTKAANKHDDFRTFIKVYSASHLMPTRYSYKQNFSNIVNKTALKEAESKKKAVSETQKKLGDDFHAGKNEWFFQKLSF